MVSHVVRLVVDDSSVDSNLADFEASSVELATSSGTATPVASKQATETTLRLNNCSSLISEVGIVGLRNT